MNVGGDASEVVFIFTMLDEHLEGCVWATLVSMVNIASVISNFIWLRIHDLQKHFCKWIFLLIYIFEWHCIVSVTYSLGGQAPEEQIKIVWVGIFISSVILAGKKNSGVVIDKGENVTLIGGCQVKRKALQDIVFIFLFGKSILGGLNAPFHYFQQSLMVLRQLLPQLATT